MTDAERLIAIYSVLTDCFPEATGDQIDSAAAAALSAARQPGLPWREARIKTSCYIRATPSGVKIGYLNLNMGILVAEVENEWLRARVDGWVGKKMIG